MRVKTADGKRVVVVEARAMGSVEAVDVAVQVGDDTELQEATAVAMFHRSVATSPAPSSSVAYAPRC